jgi:Leucine-rich repeat (LRR) protein
MKKTFVAILVGYTVLSVFCSPALGADFAPIFPKQFAPMVNPPNFTWSAGDHDLFCLFLYLPLPTGYRLFSVWRYKEPYFLITQEAMDYLTMNSWGVWRVLGITTGTGDWNITPRQYFQKVSDCVVEFPDPNLEAAIRVEIDKPAGDIMASDLQALTSLRVDNGNISDINGLEYLTNLEWLRLFYNNIIDIGPLAGLVNLDTLFLGENQINDISSLAGLTTLSVLDLPHNQITDIKPLDGHTNLVELNLFSNQIQNLDSLVGLTNLEFLSLDSNQIIDISPLAGLTNLQMLFLGNNQISNISPLANLTNLQKLLLWNNRISDISPLVGLVNLSELSLNTNQINDIFPLVQNTGIDAKDHVTVYDNPLNAISCTDYIPELQSRGVNVIHDCP